MSPIRRWALSGAFLALSLPLAAAGWWGASPWYTIHSMQAAAADGDAEAFAARVDFPALRESMKSEIRDRLKAESARTPPASLKALGLALALEFVDRMVESAVSPETLGLVLAGTSSAGAWINTPGLAALSMFAGGDLEIERDGLDRFTVRMAGEKEGARLRFQRQGLGWRLSGVDLPQAGEAGHAEI